MRYLAKRALATVVTFWVIVTLVFFLLRIAPGGPFDGERRLPPEVESNLLAAYHLDEPLPSQYLRYLGQILTGDLGPSFRQKDFSVNELIVIGIPVSLIVGGCALGLASLVGVGLGTVAALRRGPLDGAAMAVANLGLAVPSIVVAPLMVLVFAVWLRWLPAGGAGGPMHYVLPVLALSAPYTAAVARLARASVMETLALPYIVTAHAKGVRGWRLLRRHVLPVAMLPVVSYLGPVAAGLLAGSVVVEQVFSLPGIGRYLVLGALSRDYTLVMGVVVVYAALILTFNLLADLAYTRLDPRIRLV